MLKKIIYFYVGGFVRGEKFCFPRTNSPYAGCNWTKEIIFLVYLLRMRPELEDIPDHYYYFFKCA